MSKYFKQTWEVYSHEDYMQVCHEIEILREKYADKTVNVVEVQDNYNLCAIICEVY